MNRDTHNFEGAAVATLHGWRRIWRHTTLRDVAFLTVVRDAASSIDGLIAPVPAQDWAALDERERAYHRVPAAHQVTHRLSGASDIAVYAVPDGLHRAPSAGHMVLLSYVDVVVQGYLREFGEDGAARFFDTTDGWDAPVLNDRSAPHYPRHCALMPDETAIVDEHLHRLGVAVIDGATGRPQF